VPSRQIGDVELHYEDRGTGTPPLLLIAGIPAVADDWEALAAPLADERRVIAYDNRGSGASTVTPGPYTTAQLAGDAAGLLDALGIERADVFGMSLGGMIAQELALARPDLVRRLVLGCTHAGVAHAARPPKEAGRAFALDSDDWALRMRTLAPFAFASDVDRETLERFIAKKSRDVQQRAGYDGQIAAALSHDSYDRLPSIHAPTLVLTGDDDRVIPGASSRALADRIPDARLHTIAGAGHLFFVERPNETLEVLRPFLAA
jgi:pimeloyl-ACP methyl ester carboxylesterase